MEEREALGLAQMHCTSSSVKSEDSNLKEEQARKKLQWAVTQLKEDPNFHQIDIQRLIENTNWDVKSTKREEPDY